MNRREFLFSTVTIPALMTAEEKDGFVSIFDGKSLKGWSIQNGPESAFYVSDGSIVSSKVSRFPAWLRFDRILENFELNCEFFLKGWIDGGVYLHAPEHGNLASNGMLVKIFFQQDDHPKPNSMGAIFPMIAPSKVNVRNQGEWNSLRILMYWPDLSIWVNGELVQDINVESHPELRYRFRKGYLGLSGLGYPLRFRALKIRELSSRDSQQDLFVHESDFANWFVSESSEHRPVRFNPLGGVICATGLGHLATRETYQDFDLDLYVRGPKEYNGGILVRSEGKGLSGSRFYEIQLHNVEEAHYATGSLYHFKRARYPRIENDEWFPMQIRLVGSQYLVRVNGETVMEYEGLTNLAPGHIELQAHQGDSWLEFKQIRIRRL